jgi:hypothetical protein
MLYIIIDFSLLLAPLLLPLLSNNPLNNFNPYEELSISIPFSGLLE